MVGVWAEHGELTRERVAARRAILTVGERGIILAILAEILPHRKHEIGRPVPRKMAKLRCALIR
jgi:hypothetical protein